MYTIAATMGVKLRREDEKERGKESWKEEEDKWKLGEDESLT